jgi:Flp pilus assembly protein TadG
MSTRAQHGSVALELMMVAPLFLLLLLFAVAGGRIVGARNHVLGAAQDAARAASTYDDPAAAHHTATTTAAASLEHAGLSCDRTDIAVDLSRLEPGGFVTVRVTCVANLADLTFVGVPGSRTFTSQATEVVDLYRSERSER